MKFKMRYYSEKSGQTINITIESQTIGEALKRITALTIGQQARDLVIIQEDPEYKDIW